MRVAVPFICFVAAASACASGGSSAPSFVPAPEPRQFMTAEQFAVQRDSVAAQSVANEVGPGASIRAEFANVAGVRRVVATFHVNADAYVMVGHIDADGLLRIVFPLDPRDDGFVRGNRDYRTPEFFAGFAEQYRFRAREQRLDYAARQLDSYDGQLGYAFIIASWRPMKFDQFQTDGRWDTFELADEKYLDDPRPAIYELASLLAGQNREAYTVEFARYTTTGQLYAGAGGASYFGYGMFGRGLQYCAGYAPWGFSSISGLSMFMPVGLYAAENSGSFYSRGQYYYYDAFADCVRSGYPPGFYPGFYGNGYPYRVAGRTPTQPVPLRGLSPRDRSPVVPEGLGGRSMPVTRTGATDANGAIPVSSTYRERGLITPEDPGTLPGRRTPTIDARSEVETHTRPSIQEMVNRRPQTPTETQSGWARPQSAGQTTNAPSSYTPTSRRVEPANAQPRAPEPQRAEPRSYQPPPQVETRTQPAVETRSVAPVIREAPPARPTPPPEVRSMPAPQPAPPPPSPPPASSSSSSNPPSTGSRPPGPPTR